MQGKDNSKYWIDKANLEWYIRQFRNPYRITIGFKNFLEQNIVIDNEHILDIGCGPGNSLDYIAKAFPNSLFTGMDINEDLFNLYKGNCNNIEFCQGDCFDIDRQFIGKFDGVISMQTLSWLPEITKPLEEICKIRPKWIAISSLFYDGKINYNISLENYERPTNGRDFSQVYYNIYSVPLLREILKKFGYYKFRYEPFEIDIDISKPAHADLGYYTIKKDDGKRLAFNTCLYQPEGFIFAALQ